MLAAIGAVILLGVLGVVGMVLFTTAPVANPLAIGFFLVQSVAAIIMAGMLGAATGLVIAIVDQLVDGRLRDRRNGGSRSSVCSYPGLFAKPSSPHVHHGFLCDRRRGMWVHCRAGLWLAFS